MRIDILGTSFTIQTDEDPEYLNDLLDYLRTKIEEIRKKVDTPDNLKVAILASLLMADELFKERDKHKSIDTNQSKEAERITEQLIDQLNMALLE